MGRKSLQIESPELASQWHPAKNGSLTPADVTAGSGKKVWWKCPKGDDHEWPAIVANRVRGSGCPICSNQRVARSNSLGTVNPELAKEWHPTKNKELTPFDVLPSANIKIWWRCSKDPSHEWLAKLNNRANGKGCPICSNQLLVRENSLGAVNPLLAEEWHPTKNGELTPFDVAPSGTLRVWWKCPRGDDHEWQARVNSRAGRTGCPFCNPVWSIPELRIYCELLTLFPDVQHRATVNKQEVDIYIPSLAVGIEYDGVYWHQDKLDRDKAKNESLGEAILLIRLREEGLPRLGSSDICVRKRKIGISTVKAILKAILKHRTIVSDTRADIDNYLVSDTWLADEKFRKLYSERKVVAPEKSLLHLMPELAKEWHPTKNDGLVPEQFTPGSGRRVWWIGPCGHEWRDSILHRKSGRGCPKCRYKRARRTWRAKRTKGQLDLFT